MGTTQWTAGALLAAALLAPPVAAQEDDAVGAYFRAVAEFFELPPSEVEILREWRLDREEVPVVLFVAGRTGVSPEALAQLRRSGRPWTELVGRYGLDASHFHVPLPQDAPAHAVADAYAQFRATPASRWREVTLTDRDIVVLVNVRMVAQTLRLPPELVLARQGTTSSFVELYAQLLRRGPQP